jgi:hypothetical protein
VTKILATIIINLVTPKAGDTWELLFSERRGGFVEHLSQTSAAQQSVTKFMAIIFIKLVAPKGGAKQELLFNR